MSKSKQQQKSTQPTKAVEVTPEKTLGRPTHPMVGAKDGYPFKTLPPDYDFDKHRWLKKTDFDSEVEYFMYKAGEAEHRMNSYIAKADHIKKFGTGKSAQKAKRLIRMQAAIEKIKAELEAEGLDVEEVMQQEEE